MAQSTNSTPSLFERLTVEKKRLQAEATRVEPGTARNELLEKIRELDVAVHINEWLSSPGLQTPR